MPVERPRGRGGRRDIPLSSVMMWYGRGFWLGSMGNNRIRRLELIGEFGLVRVGWDGLVGKSSGKYATFSRRAVALHSLYGLFGLKSSFFL